MLAINGGFMNAIHILTDPAILVVLVTFCSIIFYFVKKVKLINTELLNILETLSGFKKSDLIFRFKELDTVMSSNAYVSNLWNDFKNTLMFSESISMKDKNDEMIFQNLSQSVTNIQCTVEPAFFFNEETLVTSRMNYKFIQTAPTLLTGLGPLFTFMHIGIAFSKVDFSSQESTINSVSGLMASMQIAATVSVLAVSTSLLFLLIERFLFNNMCKTPLHNLETTLNKLFENISSEKFLIELLKETKLQNNNTNNLLSAMPKYFKESFDKSLVNILVPYMENIVFGINKLQEKAVQAKKQSSDVVDDLF